MHGTGAEEQSALEEGVVQTLQKTGDHAERCAEADAQHHVADLAHGVKGQQPLQVVLDHGEQDADQHGGRTQPDDCGLPADRPGGEAVHAGYEVDPGLHVAGGVQQRAHRRRRFHRRRDPGVQRELHRLGRGRDQHEGEQAGGEGGAHARIGPHRRAGAEVDDEDRGQQRVAGDVRHDQHLARPRGRLAARVPEADEEERAQPHKLPACVHHEQVGTVDEVDQAGDEHQHEHVEARRRAILRHVADRVDEDGEADAGAHEREELGEPVDMVGQRHGAVPGERAPVHGLPVVGRGPQSQHSA